MSRKNASWMEFICLSFPGILGPTHPWYLLSRFFPMSSKIEKEDRKTRATSWNSSKNNLERTEDNQS